MRDGENGYGPSVGIPLAREAVAREYSSRGWPVLLAKLGARATYYRADPSDGWNPDLDELRKLITPATRAIVVIDPNNPTGATYSESTRRAIVEIAERHGVPILADEVYADTAYAGPVAPLGRLNPDAAVISFSSLSNAYLAPGWRTGWIAFGRNSRLDDVIGAMRKLADGRLCSTVPMQYAVAAALDGDRSHQASFRSDLQARAMLTAESLRAIPGISCVAPLAAFYAMPQVTLPPGRTDEHYVLSLLRETGVLCVYGSGFGMPARDGYLRIVFLAPLQELRAVYDLMAQFTADYLARS
jgi:alanine-synthesizing transaminase